MIFALFVFSYLFGLVGTLVAVPLAAAMGVLVRFAVQLYLDSSVYKGSGAAADGGAVPAAKEQAMTATPDQLVLDLAHRPALEAEDFLVSRSNQAAADFIDRWPDWPQASAVVVAPAARRQDAPGQRLAPEVGGGPARGRPRSAESDVAWAGGRAAGRGPARRHRRRARPVPPAEPGARAQACRCC